MFMHSISGSQPTIAGSSNAAPLIDVSCINRYLYEKQNHWFAETNTYHLNTVLQPIYSLAHQRVVGHEALARIEDKAGKRLNPAHVFYSKQDSRFLTLLDRLCRMIHVKNYIAAEDTLNWLFLNVSPLVIDNSRTFGSFFGELLHETGFPPHRVVIEIVEHPITDQELLEETVAYYKNLGCLIAIDDFGSGQSNFERIWSLNPNIVKLDRSMIQRASEQYKIRSLLPGIVSLLHQTGALVLMEGIETEEQAMIALECDADFVQGFYFSQPVAYPFICDDCMQLFSGLFSKYKSYTSAKTRDQIHLVERFKPAFYHAIDLLEAGCSIVHACEVLFNDNAIVRAYQLRPDGVQIDETVHRGEDDRKQDIRYKPIQSANRADWFRRHYLQRAVFHPNQMQVTRPYLSITGAHMCVTISMLYQLGQENRVFCCDVDWEDITGDL